MGLRVWDVPAPGSGGGGRAARCSPRRCGWGGQWGGNPLPRSIPLPSLGRQQSGSLWHRSGHGGRGLHTARVRAHLRCPGAVRVAHLCAGAGLLVHHGSCGSRRLGAWRPPLLWPPSRTLRPCRGEGRASPLPLGGGLGPAPPRPAGRWGGLGGQGGGVTLWFPTSLLRQGWPVILCQVLPSSPAQPPGCTRSARVVGQHRAPDAACRRQVSLAGGGGASCEPSSPEEWPGV